MNSIKDDSQKEEAETELPELPSRTSIHFREPFSPSARRSHELRSPPPAALSSIPYRSQSQRSPASPSLHSDYASSPSPDRSKSLRSSTSPSQQSTNFLAPSRRRSSLRSPITPTSPYDRRRSHDIQKFPSAASPYAAFTPFSATTADSYGTTEPDPLNHRVSIDPSELPPIPKPAGQLTSETQQPRWWLRVQAIWWRAMMRIGMRIHDWVPPPPPRPSFHRYIETHATSGDISRRSTPIDLAFYVPENYHRQIRHSVSSGQPHRYPILVNYHGGGFVLGSNVDDRYWFRSVLENTPCVVVSVGYRRAPEHPFPTAVDDCVDTLLYLSAHAHELGLDPSKIILSGFSAGANFTFAVPLRLKYHVSRYLHRGKSICLSDAELSRFDTTKGLLSSAQTNSPTIIGIVAWYPLVDFATPRDHKRAISIKPKKTMPKFFTNLFDQSYLPDVAGLNHSSPYVSPGRAPDKMLRDGLPDSIQIYVCEWDMLLREGQMFAKHLRELGKSVTETLVKGHPHAWDKSPNPWRDQQAINKFYADACEGIVELLEKAVDLDKEAAEGDADEAAIIE